MPRSLLTPQARRDAVEIARYIAADNRDVANDFLIALQDTCTHFAVMPERGRRYGWKHSALKDVRVMRVSKTFGAYLIFYLPTKDGVRIIRILHGARDFPTMFGTLSNVREAAGIHGLARGGMSPREAGKRSL
ncbi:hypothetical protein A3J43_02265 [Candidatus Uhrbacteria bacterium RIFCSPHIGHO2_12_FULL_54_23]|nr:MAG: hypothetical protein A3J43_02265 [Candidatus Uhrbacteria bacterium RIFCSPHIGHO2_12_FULL_54_23]